MLVCFSHLRWGFVWQRPQHLLSRFARRMPVVVVEEPREEGSAPGLRVERHGGVTVVTPLVGPAIASPTGFGASVNATIGAELERFFRSDPAFAGCPRPVLWYYTPVALGAEPPGWLDKALVVYDAMDDLASFGGASSTLREREDALLARADLVFAGGPSLHAARRDRHPEVHCFPSGVDAAHFAATSAGHVPPPDLDARPRPILGFYGVLDERLDLGLVDAVAASRPDWTLAMVGPVAKIAAGDLPRRPNIAYFGKQAYDDLPAFLARFDVGLLPFARNDATRFISPTKTLEYLAGGKPVVSTPIADVVALYGDVVRFAAAADTFVGAIEAVLAETAAARERRLETSRRLVAEHAWDGIADRMMSLVEEADGRRRADEGARLRRLPRRSSPELRGPAEPPAPALSTVELHGLFPPSGDDPGQPGGGEMAPAAPRYAGENGSTYRPPLEVWGGIECTVNRVGDHYLDQSARNGHDERLDDLDRFAGLGIRAIRYPVLWEQTAPGSIERADWRRPDERLGRLRDLGVRPIVGLVHHGSGPRDTSLLDPAFPERLAAFAGAVARRYPWLEDWTPVNEPLTTARFSALYGHWYPHHRDDLSFARALLTECRAVVLAMRAIRETSPAARLVQTDDLGKTFSTPALAYQAEFENERRWVTWDLLAGHLTPDRLMWRWFRRVGVPEADLGWFLENPCPPDVVGVNTYLSSERFLDERVAAYPAETPGTNRRHAYVDVLAARVLPEGAAGPEGLLREAWDRFGLPVAVTEAHNGCTREEQLRWLDEVWRGAERARAAGADVRAVTVWSLLGAYDWRSLVTRDEGDYEPGVFDLRSPVPRPTAIAHMVRDLASKGRHDHPVLEVPGWWRRPDRFIYGHTAGAEGFGETGGVAERDGCGARPLLIVGEGGPVVASLTSACRQRSIPYHLVDRPTELMADPAAAAGLLRELDAWAVLDVDRGESAACAERGSAGCAICQDSVTTSGVVVAACARAGLPLLAVSSDLVFDGRQPLPYGESAPVSPGGACSRRYAVREREILAVHPSALVVRTGPLFGGEGGVDPIASALAALAAGEPFVAAADEVVSPTYAPDFADAALDLLVDGEQGLWHLANRGSASWFDLTRRAADLAGIDRGGIIPRVRHSTFASQYRPHRILQGERGWLLPELDAALARHVQDITSTPAVAPDADGKEFARAAAAPADFERVAAGAVDLVIGYGVSGAPHGSPVAREIPVRWAAGWGPWKGEADPRPARAVEAWPEPIADEPVTGW
jgi:dTDP-4-dehydrorhamnose reductase